MRTNILYAGLIALTIPFYSCKKDQPQKSLPEVPSPAPVDTTPSVREYVVKKGDYLAKIVREQLNIKEWDVVREEILKIQSLNSSLLTDDRDIYKPTICSDYFNSDSARGIVCPRLVAGKDSLVDLIYPGEKLILPVKK